MTQSPWKYERLERKGFLLYSVGRNGIDEGGNYRSGINVREMSEDDRAWYVDPNIPALPEFTLRTFQPKENSSEMSPDMRRRYGLQPADIGPKGAEAKIPEAN